MNNLIEVTDDKNIKTSDYLGPLIQNDHIDKIIFKIKKNYGDIDLSTYGFTLIYVIADKDKSGDISTEASGEITKTIEDDYILITWSIPLQATSQEGELKIQIVANLDDSYWHSRIGVFQVYSELVPSESDFTPSLLGQVEAICTTISLYADTISQTKQDIIALTEAAVTSEGNAKTSEENAATSESNAKTSEKNAKASEESAAESKEAAASSEGNAKISKENAATSESNASISEKNAKTSEESAAESKEAAATSESNAKTSEENAATSESNAKTSEKNAKASEESAAESKEAAATSESNAKTSEENAATSESNAKASEKNAKASEESAAESKEAAATSEENASALYTATKQQIEDGNVLSNVNDDLYSMGISLVGSRPQIKYTKVTIGEDNE